MKVILVELYCLHESAILLGTPMEERLKHEICSLKDIWTCTDRCTSIKSCHMPVSYNFTLHVAIRSSRVSLINLRASLTFLSRGETSFQIGISQTGIGETLLSSASLRTV